MSTFDIILLVMGVGLLLLGSVSGYALFARALKITDKYGDETNIGSLWALFLIGLSAGLLLIWLGLP